MADRMKVEHLVGQLKLTNEEEGYTEHSQYPILKEIIDVILGDPVEKRKFSVLVNVCHTVKYNEQDTLPVPSLPSSPHGSRPMSDIGSTRQSSASGSRRESWGSQAYIPGSNPRDVPFNLDVAKADRELEKLKLAQSKHDELTSETRQRTKTDRYKPPGKQTPVNFIYLPDLVVVPLELQPGEGVHMLKNMAKLKPRIVIEVKSTRSRDRKNVIAEAEKQAMQYCRNEMERTRTPPHEAMWYCALAGERGYRGLVRLNPDRTLGLEEREAIDLRDDWPKLKSMIVNPPPEPIARHRFF